MDLRKLKKLIDLVQESGISELEVTEGEEKVRIAKHISGPAPVNYVTQAPAAAPSPAAPAAAVAAAAAEPSTPEGHVVKSPMVGTFYRSSAPGGKPLVEIGQSVSAGEPLCIIEAMKLFNEIESEVSGKIVKVLVNDSTPIEYDQPLFLVEPA